MVILLVCLEMLRELQDALAENRYLNFWRTCVSLVDLVLSYDLRLLFVRQCHSRKDTPRLNLYLLLFLIRPSGMGLGDVKLAASVGAALGWQGWGQVAAATCLAFAAAALYAVGLLLFRRATPATQFSLGPFMLLGALAVILA